MRPTLAVFALMVTACGSMTEAVRYAAYQRQPDGGRTLLAKGTREYSPTKDIEIIDASKPDRPHHWAKRLPLFGGYELEADVYREATLDGFGLAINERSNPEGFSWNWFDREQEDVFVKRRGHGRIKAMIRKVDGLSELASVEFLEDTTLGYTHDMLGLKPGESTHVFVIMKGSVLRLPVAAP